MKQPVQNNQEQKCPARNGTGFPINKPMPGGRKIYPKLCEVCDGKEIRKTAN